MQLQALLKSASAGKTHAEISVSQGDVGEVFITPRSNSVFVTLTSGGIKRMDDARKETRQQPLCDQFFLANENSLVVVGDFKEIQQALSPSQRPELIA